MNSSVKRWGYISVLLIFCISVQTVQSQDTTKDRSIVEENYKFMDGSNHPDEPTADSLQWSIYNASQADDIYKIAERYYGVYKKYPNTESGKQSLISAFRRWSSIDSLQRMKNVHNTIPIDADVWANITDWLRYPYYDRYQKEEFIQRAKKWYEKATNLKSKTHLATMLGDYYQDKISSFRRQNKEVPNHVKLKAIRYFENVLEWNEDSLVTNNSDIVDYVRRNYESVTGLKEEEQAPDFTSKTLSGDKISLSELTEDNVVLLDFWASWCGPCLGQIPLLKEVWKKYKDENFRLVSITLDRKKKPWKKLVRDSSLNWTHIYQEGDFEGKLSRKYGVRAIPYTYLIDQGGTIVEKGLRGEKLKEAVSKFVQETTK